VEDHDPKRAAELANGYVDEFRKLSASLAITEAARRRLFFEQQLQEAKDKLSTAEDALTKTQQTTGVLQIDSQAKALIESAAVLRGQVEAKQVQIEGLRSFATEDNPRLLLAKQELAALQSELSRVAGSKQDAGSDINLSKGRVTQSGMEYLRRYRDVKYQETVFELLAKEFEVAKLDEAREGSIVQVVDAAVVPDRKASPHRRVFRRYSLDLVAQPVELFPQPARKPAARPHHKIVMADEIHRGVTPLLCHNSSICAYNLLNNPGPQVQHPKSDFHRKNESFIFKSTFSSSILSGTTEPRRHQKRHALLP